MIMQKGFFDKIRRDDMNFANVAFIIDAFATGLAGKKANYKTFIKGWFGEVDKPMTAEEHRKRSEEMMKRVELTNKILAEKENLFNAGKLKNSN